MEHSLSSIDKELKLKCVVSLTGRTLKVRLSANHLNTESNLGQLCGMALVSGFDWVYFEGSNYIRISVIPDGKRFCPNYFELPNLRP